MRLRLLNKTALGALTDIFFHPPMERIFGRYGPYIMLTLAVTISQLVFLAPYWLDGTIDIVYRYWDGPNYAYLAKAFYNVPVDHPLKPYVKPEYFAAHLPLYPAVIRLFSFMGYNSAMLFTTFLFTWAATLTFYQLLKENTLVESPVWSAFIALFIPARYVIYHNVGATEAPFIFFICGSLLFYFRGNYIAAFLMGGFAGITRITGVLLGAGYLISLVWEKKWRWIPALALVGLPLFLTFAFYHFHYGDFFAYFNVNLSSTNKLIRSTPFLIFKSYAGHGENHSAEFYLAMYALFGLGTLLLFKISKVLFSQMLVMCVFSIFIFHQDLARYLIPMAPFAIVVAYDKIISQKATRLAATGLIPLIYVYAWKVLPHNLCVAWVYKNLKVYLLQ